MNQWILYKWLMYYRNGKYIDAIKMLRSDLEIGLKDAHHLHKWMISVGQNSSVMIGLEKTLYNVFIKTN